MSLRLPALPHVVAPAALSELGDRLISIANSTGAALDSMREHWQRLPDVFDVTGAEGAFTMLDRPVADAHDFATALVSARNALWEAASVFLPPLVTRRAELASRIADVTAAHDDAQEAWTRADAAYWRTARGDDAGAVDDALAARDSARRVLEAAEQDGARLRDDIERFRDDVEDAEDLVAQQLRRIAGGDAVHGAWGAPIHVSQTYWGYVDAPAPSAPAAATTLLGAAARLRGELSDAVIRRIAWLGSADRARVRSWYAAHPDFASAVGFVEPGRATRLWEGLVADSVAGEGTAWIAGPLAQLLALAPAAIGNLNGLRARDRAPFTLASLRAALADRALDDGTRRVLGDLAALVDPATGSATLLSFFLDQDGSPRASLAFGDVDTAGQITTLSHGIETDLHSLGDWADSARALRTGVDNELASTGSDVGTAVVLFFEWDSGSTGNVWNIERPDSGAERLAQLLRGFEASNPAAQRNLGLHSLGTTMGGQLMADNPGLVDNAWLYGSAGVTDDAGRRLGEEIADGALTLHATHAADDFIAPIGRWPVSEHPVDPRTIPGVDVFGSDGGFVEDGAGDSAWGERTEGHNSQRSSEWYYLFEGFETGIDGSPVPVWDDASTGYLDPSAQSFKQTVLDLARAAERAEAGAR